MIFVDTNVFMYAVGREHPLREEAQAFFVDAVERGLVLVTSAEVIQELLHAYLPVNRVGTLDLALELIRRSTGTVWPVEAEDVLLARSLAETHPGLGARDLLHRACCLRRGVDALKTFDRALRATFR